MALVRIGEVARKVDIRHAGLHASPMPGMEGTTDKSDYDGSSTFRRDIAWSQKALGV